MVAIKNQGSSTKCRAVFDASRRQVYVASCNFVAISIRFTNTAHQLLCERYSICGSHDLLTCFHLQYRTKGPLLNSRVTRWFGISLNSVQLYGFVDTSIRTYAAVVYIRNVCQTFYISAV